MQIVNFDPEYFEDVMQIEMEAFTEHNPFLYMNFYEMNREGFRVAVIRDTVIGFIVGYHESSTKGRIFSLAVKQNFQGRGVATRLIMDILKRFRKCGLMAATLEVRLSNEKAQQLYKKTGFVPCWIEKGYYSDGEDGLIMKKHLSHLPLKKDQYINPEIVKRNPVPFRIPKPI